MVSITGVNTMKISEGLTVKDCINFEKDIKPYRIIQIIAGVGAGKNYWVCNDLINRGAVLFITSRRITAVAQAGKMQATRFFDFDTLSKKGFGKRLEHNVVVTNSRIEKYITTEYKEDDEKTHIWNDFDFIVLDEAHSLSMDATFADAPFHVEKFIRECIHRNKKCRLILMTGTPHPMKWMVPDELMNHSKFNCINLLEKCTHIVPDKIVLEPCKIAVFDIAHTANTIGSGTVVVFTKHLHRILELYSKIVDEGVDKNSIGIIYANKEDNDNTVRAAIVKHKNIPENTVEKTQRIRKFIQENELIPDDIKVLFATYTMKEGANINNEDVHTVFVESVIPADIVQMAGRFRKTGSYELRVLYNHAYNSEGKESFGEKDFQRYVDECVIEKIENVYSEYNPPKIYSCEEIKSEVQTEDLIDEEKAIFLIENKFPNIRYNRFAKKFESYSGRIEGNKYQIRQTYYILKYVKKWYNEQPVWTEDDEFYLESGKTLFQQCFPKSKVTLLNEQVIKKEFKKILNELGLLKESLSKEGVIIDTKKRDEIVSRIKDMPTLWLKVVEADVSTKSPKTLLKRFGYSLEETPKKRKGTSFTLSWGEIEKHEAEENEET